MPVKRGQINNRALGAEKVSTAVASVDAHFALYTFGQA